MSFEDIPDDSEPREPGDGGFENFSDDEMLFPDNTDPVTADSDGEPDIEDGPGIVREPLDAEDQPHFDIVKFETEAIGRAKELSGQVRRLAAFEVHEDEEDKAQWLKEKGAQYDLADGRKVEVKYEVWHNDPKKNVTKIRISQPPVESVGPDGQLCRTLVSRCVYFSSFIETLPDEVPAPEVVADTDGIIPEDPGLAEMFEAVSSEIQAAKFEDRMNPDFRPAELVRARTDAVVECKLPSSPNYRTERYSTDMPVLARMSHIVALRRADVPERNPGYTVAEHKGVVALLASLTRKKDKPEPLDSDFDQEWHDPEATLRAWWPNRNII